jgi:hypothetical protein
MAAGELPKLGPALKTGYRVLSDALAPVHGRSRCLGHGSGYERFRLFSTLQCQQTLKDAAQGTQHVLGCESVGLNLG